MKKYLTYGFLTLFLIAAMGYSYGAIGQSTDKKDEIKYVTASSAKKDKEKKETKETPAQEDQAAKKN